MSSNKLLLFPEIEKVINNFNYNIISAERKLTLQPLIDFIQLKVDHDIEIRLNFIEVGI